jgi:hypothetical protein
VSKAPSSSKFSLVSWGGEVVPERSFFFVLQTWLARERPSAADSRQVDVESCEVERFSDSESELRNGDSTVSPTFCEQAGDG